MLIAKAQLLHIPDGFLNTVVSIVCWLFTVGVLYVAVKRANKQFDERLVPLAGVMAAFVFAGQMINFPVAAGTSGHLIGATLAFVVLGPSLGLLAMTAVIALQALLFQDGGLVVMGANILVMGIVPGYVGYVIHQFAAKQEMKKQLLFAGISGWVSVMMAALVTTLLLTFSGTTNALVALPTMLGVHALIGIGEALITVGALGFIMRTRPGLFTGEKDSGKGSWLVIGMVLVLTVILMAPLASGSPDGLEWAAESLGFIDTAQDASYQILPDYTIPGLGETPLSTILAGVVGALIVAFMTFGTVRTIQKSE